MKLVTGIEAIQSGKPFRLIDAGGGKGIWYDADTTQSIQIKMLRIRQWEIKEEPREFWLDISKPSCVQIYPIDCQGIDFSRDEFIKVREVEK